MDISTHAPRVRRDDFLNGGIHPGGHFYSRASCEARLPLPAYPPPVGYFYSRASCEARLSAVNSSIFGVIYTHAPRVRSDSAVGSLPAPNINFYSRASCEARRKMS